MADLKEFIETFHIDTDALARMKKRVYIVGRFNQRAKGTDPEVYLFTNRGNLTELYAKNFTSVFDMRYDSFVQALRPSIAEQIDESGRFPIVRQNVPKGDGALEGTSVIDVFNYFFQRAVANSSQKAFEDERPGLPPELLQEGDRTRGKAILRQIRKNLETFCAFQPHTHLIVERFATLMSAVALEYGLPSFGTGGPLPGGLPERIVDFLYAQDVRASFDLRGLDFSGPWQELADEEGEGRRTFQTVVGAFRDAMLKSRAQQYNAIRFRGNKPLSELADRAAAGLLPMRPRNEDEDPPEDELREGFRDARVAFNGLREILRSKVLLSMVLEWVLSGYYDVKDVRSAAQNEYARDKALEKAVLERWQENGLARPVKRPSRQERRRFSQMLTESFEKVLAAVIASEETAEKKVASLAPELRGLVKNLRANPERRRLLATVAGADLDDELQQAFRESAKAMLLDVLVPPLYRSPILTVQMLKRQFREESMAAYLTAVFLGESSQEAVSDIARKHLDFFESKIDDATKSIRDEDEILGLLLGDFLDVLANPNIARRLSEGVRVLHEIHGLLEHTALDRERKGGGGMSSIRTASVVEGSLEETPVDRHLIRIAVEQRVEAKTAELAAAGDSGDSAGSGSSAGGAASANQSESGSCDGDEAKESDDSSDTRPSRLDRTIDEILKRNVAAAMPEQFSGMDETKREAISANVVKEVMSDAPLIGNLAEDLVAFERTLHLIYSRYNENPDKRSYRNKVERMTLTNMMLLFQDELGLGRMSSNLYQLLLDLVLHLEPSADDPREFMREKSLTVYFDDADLENLGLEWLRQALEVQGARSLDSIVNFVSELRGVKYLMDAVGPEGEAEVVVVNATAKECLNWFRADNLTAGQGKAGLRSGRLVRTDEASERTIPPGLVYFTDIAFADVNKMAWIKSLTEESLSEDALSYVLPPICLSTGPQDNSGLWVEEGTGWSYAADAAPAAVTVLGPTPRLNPAEDGFPTVLPAGYVFAAHLLGSSEQALRIDNVAAKSNGRFRIIGYGEAGMDASMERVIWGEGDEDSYAFAVDYYLYVILTLLATAKRFGSTKTVDKQEFYRCFFYSQGQVTGSDRKAFESSDKIKDALVGGNALVFSLDQNPAVQGLEGVSFVMPPATMLEANAKRRQVTSVGWFGRAVQKMGL